MRARRPPRDAAPHSITAVPTMTTRRPPNRRRLRVFAFDPSLDRSLETAVLNRIVLDVAWERDPTTKEDLPLRPGPVGEYLEVVDVDPASGAVYAPVDLDDPYVLAQDGLEPAEGDPQFHQQMVYAVAMNTIRNFEEALGRRVLWSSRYGRTKSGRRREEYVQRLRMYPHALREANAYYSPEKKALLFGYFPADPVDPGSMLPGTTVFTCLSHDIVVHETTHALLDGLHRRFIEPSNPDVLAFHEAFADIVALFQHFSHPDVLRHQIARTRGDLEKQSLLGRLAQEFGQAIGQRGALRDAIGGIDPNTGEWQRKEPDPSEIGRTHEPHARGAILVAAVFDAFLSIYRSRIVDLLRIATGGTGVLPVGEIHPDLVGRLATEAAKSAQHILRMCIRALDYCPPVDPTFGDYLRALVTADADVVPVDTRDYRLAFIEAFRRRGIYPHGVRSMSEASLLWRPPPREDREAFAKALRSVDELRQLCPEWTLESDREKIFGHGFRQRTEFQRWLTVPPLPRAVQAVGLTLDKNAPPSVYRSRRDGLPAIEVHSVRPALRVGLGGRTLTDLVVELTQRRRGYLDPNLQQEVDAGRREPPGPDFLLRGGATLLIDLESGEVRYCVGKGILSDRRLQAQRDYLRRGLTSLGATYFGDNRFELFGKSWQRESREPFALLHGSTLDEGVP